MEENKIEDILDVGAWLGRKQAFSLISGRCSAAGVVCLRKIREGKQYRGLGLTWDEFCRQRAGVSRAYADKVIQQLEELGPTWFELSSVTRITPDHFRRIAEAVTEEGLSYAGETIEIVPENGPKLVQAIEDLTRLQEPEHSQAETAERTFARAVRSLHSALADLERLSAMPLDMEAKSKLAAALAAACDKLEQIALAGERDAPHIPR